MDGIILDVALVDGEIIAVRRAVVFGVILRAVVEVSGEVRLSVQVFEAGEFAGVLRFEAFPALKFYIDVLFVKSFADGIQLLRREMFPLHQMNDGFIGDRAAFVLAFPQFFNPFCQLCRFSCHGILLFRSVTQTTDDFDQEKSVIATKNVRSCCFPPGSALAPKIPAPNSRMNSLK